MENLLKQNLVWRIFYFASAFVLNFCIARFAGAKLSGSVFYYTNLFSFFVLICSFSLESSFTYFASSNKNTGGKIAVFSIFWVGLVLIGLFVFYLFSNSLLGYSRNYFLLFGVPFIIGNMMVNFFQALFYSIKDFVTPNKILGIINFAFAFILSYQLMQNHYDFLWIIVYFAFNLLSGISLLVLWFIKNRRSIFFSFPEIKLIKQIFKYASLAFLANIIFFIEYRIDYWFVNKYCSGEDLGNYIQASKLAHMIILIPQTTAAFIFPMIASNNYNKDIQMMIEKLVRLIIQSCVALFLFVLLAGKWIFIFALGESYQSMYQIMLSLIPGITSLCLLSLLSAYFGGKNKVLINISSAAIGCCVVVLGNVAVTSIYSSNIAAIISSVGYTVSFIAAFYLYRKETKHGLGKILSWNIQDWKWLYTMLTNNKSS